MELDFIKGKKVAELREIASALKVEGAAKMKKAELVELLTRMHQEAEAARAEAEKAAEADAENLLKKPKSQEFLRLILL